MPETNGTTALAERELLDTIELLQERLVELELAREDVGWQRLALTGQEREFSRQFLRDLAHRSRLFYLHNPLINRAVNLQSFYVFGQGLNITARHPDVNDVVQRFLDDEKNRAELTTHQARTLKEIALQVEGNLFFVLFTNRTTGRVRVRTVPPDEVDDIICNPEDAREPWYYKRSWYQRRLDGSGFSVSEKRTAYYPDWRYRPATKPQTLGGDPVEWETPVYHVKVGGLPDMRFGVPETYAALDWAQAHRQILEDDATRSRALARFALKMTTRGGSKGVAAARAKLGTTVSTGTAETNPPPTAGSTFIGAEGVEIEALKIGGAMPPTDHHRPFKLQVAAATGVPETMFGDADVGNLATSKTLDRPTELKFRDRQTLWADVHRDLLNYAVDAAALVAGSPLGGKAETDDDGEPLVILADDSETGEPIDRHIDVAFPPILEHDVDQMVKAIALAATLGGQGTFAGTLDAKLTTRLLLQSLGVEDIDEHLEELFPEGQPQASDRPSATDTEPPPDDDEPDVQAAETAAIQEAVQRAALPAPDAIYTEQVERALHAATMETYRAVGDYFIGLGERIARSGELRESVDPSRLYSERAEVQRLYAVLLAGSNRLSEQLWPVVGVRIADQRPMTSDDPVLLAVRERVSERIPRIWKTTRERLRQMVETANERGYTAEQLVNGVEADRFRGVRATMRHWSLARAQTIARTELAHYANALQVEWFKVAGIEKVRMIDGTTFDETCAARNGKEVTLAVYETELASEHPNGRLCCAPVMKGNEA